MLITYAHELSFGELNTFLERVLSEKFGKKVLVKMENLMDCGAGRIIDFKLITPMSTIICTANFSSFQCVVSSNDINFDTQFYKKEWAKYVCEVLGNRKVINNLHSVTALQYRSDYNDYWTSVKENRIKQAQEEFDQNILY